MRFIYPLSFVLLSCQFLSAQTATTWKSGGHLNPIQRNMDIKHYTLSLAVDPTNKKIDGYLEAKISLTQPADTILLDLIDQLNVSRVSIDKRNATFNHRSDKIFITNTKSFAAGEHVVRIDYGGQPPVAARPPWNGGFTWTKDAEGNPWVVINCQLDGAKVYFPCKDHPSDEPDEGVDLLIQVPKPLVVAGPGLLTGVTSRGNNSIYHWKTNYPISNYCVLFNIAKYHVVKRNYTTIDGHIVPMEYYILPQNENQAGGVLDIRERDTRILEKYFGEYPWAKEKIGIAQVPNPGMEHQTMITYGDPFNYQRFKGQNYSANLFHEFAHEWWANKITNKDWAHMWIQEGTATYAEALCFRELTGEAGYDSMMTVFRARVRNAKAIVLGDEVDSQETYTGDTYFKGAVFLHTLRFVLGDKVFFATLKKLATDPQYTYNHFVTTDDVEKLFSHESGLHLKPLFDFYLRTTQRLEILAKQTGPGTWSIESKNVPMALPLDIGGQRNIERVELSNKPIIWKGEGVPVIDPGNHYLKRVTIE